MTRATKLVVAWIATCAFAAEIGGAADLEMAILRPDGRPAANAAVEIVSAERTDGRDESLHAKAMTDALGRARFAWPEGVWRIEVRVPGVGPAQRDWLRCWPAGTTRCRCRRWRRSAGSREHCRQGPGSKTRLCESTAGTSLRRRFSQACRRVVLGGSALWHLLDRCDRWQERLAEVGRIVVVGPGETVANVPLEPVPATNQTPISVSARARRRADGSLGQRHRARRKR